MKVALQRSYTATSELNDIGFMTGINLLDVVALTEELPDRGLHRGQVGTVVETLAPGVYEVEFSDDEGRTFASLALRADQLLVLHYQPVKVA